MKQQIINHIIDVEGGFRLTNDALDAGGMTWAGISRRFNAGWPGWDLIDSGDRGSDTLQQMTRDFYAVKYWNSVRGDDLAALSEHVAREVVDTAVNMGVARAGGFLQRALNVLNDRGTLYADLVVDGAIGPRTVEALGQYLATRNELALSRALNCLQGAFYIELAERREKDERFVYGWLVNRVVI